MQKNKLSILPILILLLFGNPVLAERSSGYCAVFEEEKGKEVLSLYPKVNFHSVEYNSLKNRIWLDAWIRSEDLYDGIRLQEKSKIFDASGKAIGKVAFSFNPLKILETKDTLTHVILAGFIEKSCIDNTFIPEEELSKLLEKAANNEKKDYFDAFFSRYQLTETRENNNYTSYLLVQPNFTTQTMEPRLLLVFYKFELIAIFHTRTIQVKRYDSIEMGSQYKMVYNSKFSEHTKMEMVNIYKTKFQN